MPAPIDLTGRPIIITGASSGIGAASALACARAGMLVTLFARRENKLNDIKARIEDCGGTAMVVVGDVTNPQANIDAIDRTVDVFGSVYAVIANAGYVLEHPGATMPMDTIRAMFETNFFGSLNLVQPAIERFSEQGFGHAMMVSSCLSKVSVPYYACYCATKAAQDNFCRAMRIELKDKGIHVSSVHPIRTRTELSGVSDALTEGGLVIASKEDSRFMQSAEQVANAIVRCLRKPKGEVWTSLPTRLAIAGSVAFPGITDSVLLRVLRKRLKDSNAR